MNEKYIARCHKRLKEWGAPLDGWYCLNCYDVCENGDEELFECELCGCKKVRYVHVMRHDQYFEDIHVGCICAGVMAGDILAEKERERKTKNRMKRRETFLRRKWQFVRWGTLRMDYKDKVLLLYRCPDGTFRVSCDGEMLTDYKGKPLKDRLSAAYAAFDAADPEV